MSVVYPRSDQAGVYVGIGNSDNKLSQQRWSQFVRDTRHILLGGRLFGGSAFLPRLMGEWHALPDEPYQNAQWLIQPPPVDHPNAERLREQLAELAATYGQDSIAWAPAPYTEFLGPTHDKETR